MPSFMTLDEARAELIGGGRRFFSLDLAGKQKADAKQLFSNKASASSGGENVIAATQNQMQFNNVGFAELG